MSMQQASALAGVEEAGVGFLRPAVQISGKDTRTARRRSGGTQSVLRWMIVTLIAFAVTFLIISCVRGPRPRAVQTYAWRRLAGSEGDEEDESLCLEQLFSGDSHVASPAQSEQEVPTEAGGDGQQQQEGPLGGAVMGGGQQQQGELMEEAAVGEQNPQPSDLVGGETVGDGQQQQGESVGVAPVGEEQQQEGMSVAGKAMGEGQQQQGESMGRVEGKETQQRGDLVGVTACAQSSPDGKQESNVPTSAADEVKGGAVTPKGPEVSVSSATGVPVPGLSGGKKKAKTKHLESPPVVQPPDEGEEYDDPRVPSVPTALLLRQMPSEDSDTDEEPSPTYKWPTGLLYNIDPSKLTAGMTQQTGVAGIKPETKPKSDGARPPEKKPDPRQQSIKLRTLSSILEKSVQTADEVASNGDEESVASASWLVGEVVQALSVQVEVARKESQNTSTEPVVEDLCVMAEAAVLVARDWVANHGGLAGEVQPATGPGQREGDRSPVAVRMMVLTLAQDRLRRQADLINREASQKARDELEKFAKMAVSLISSTESMLEDLRSQKQHAAAVMVRELLNLVKEAKTQAESLVLTYDSFREVFKPPTPEELVRSALDDFADAEARIDAFLKQLEAGADHYTLRDAQEQVNDSKKLLAEVQEAMQYNDVVMGSLTDPAFALQEKIELLQTVLDSAKS